MAESPGAQRPRPLRIAVLGAECSGKSTVAEALAERLGPTATHVPEYARSRWSEWGSSGFGYADMLPIAQMQARLEEMAVLESVAPAAVPTIGLLLCDTTPLATLYYSLASFGKAPLALWALSARAYDAVLLCAPDMPFVQDGQRTGDAFRQRQHLWLVQALGERDTGYTLLHGPLPQRLHAAAAALAHIGGSAATRTSSL